MHTITSIRMDSFTGETWAKGHQCRHVPIRISPFDSVSLFVVKTCLLIVNFSPRASHFSPSISLIFFKTDDINSRIRSHRITFRSQPLTFAFIPVGSKSEAKMIESIAIKRLQDIGVPLTNKGDQYKTKFGGAGQFNLPF